jgi:hypothetical protein
MEYSMLKQKDGQDYSKFMISLKDVAARADKEIKTNEVWMKLNEALQRKCSYLRFKSFADLDDFCLDQESAYYAIKALYPRTITGARDDIYLGIGPGRGRGRGRGAFGNPPDRRTQSAPASVVRYIPREYENMPKAREPVEAARITRLRLCWSCRKLGHASGDPTCIFSRAKGRYAFADVPREMPRAKGDAYLRQYGGRVTAWTPGGASNNVISLNAITKGQFELPAPEEQLTITQTPDQGNGQART